MDHLDLPPAIASALFITARWFPGLSATGHPQVHGLLPWFPSSPGWNDWDDTWFGDRSAVWLARVGGQPIRFEPPPGFPEFCDAMASFAATLKPELRRLILTERPDLDFEGDVDACLLKLVEESVGAERFHLVACEVWFELQEQASTSHGHMRLKAEQLRLEAEDA